MQPITPPARRTETTRENRVSNWATGGVGGDERTSAGKVGDADEHVHQEEEQECRGEGDGGSECAEEEHERDDHPDHELADEYQFTSSTFGGSATHVDTKRAAPIRLRVCA
jgi:hypothetical protein